MNRVLNLQALENATEANDDLQSQSSCSWALCGFCSSTSEAGCGPSNPGDTVVVAV